MATDFTSIPIIDISCLVEKWDDANMGEDAGVLNVVRQLDEACRLAGFFYVKGHGIPDTLLKEVKDITRQFFYLPLEEKIKIKLSAETGYRGYQEVGDNITKGVPDMHEAIDVGDGASFVGGARRGEQKSSSGVWVKSWKAAGEGGEQGCDVDMNSSIGRCVTKNGNMAYMEISENLWKDLTYELSRKIMRGIALALGCSRYELEGKIAGDPVWVTRLLGYPVVSKANGCSKAENDIGCGAHTDYGLLTLVNQDEDVTALQVQNHSGEWIWAPPIPGTFVCNIGDMLKILTNGIYESTLHRVINNSPKYRICVAYFYETNFDAVIEPMEICVQKTGGIKKLGRAVYGEHLVSKVKNNFRY
ncbi:hypothetical protein KSS87_002248 [Heliosperma pusillum]|nr:hypothetical protein KSS87_002248 [Heliosperma pusillum]